MAELTELETLIERVNARVRKDLLYAVFVDIPNQTEKEERRATLLRCLNRNRQPITQPLLLKEMIDLLKILDQYGKDCEP